MRKKPLESPLVSIIRSRGDPQRNNVPLQSDLLLSVVSRIGVRFCILRLDARPKLRNFGVLTADRVIPTCAFLRGSN
jgi:hypothetical protein